MSLRSRDGYRNQGNTVARTKKTLTLPENHVIAKAVQPLRDAAVAQAAERALAFLKELKAKVDAQPLLDTLAPFPEYVSYRAPRAEHVAHTAAHEFRTLVRELTEELPDPNADDYSQPDMPTTVVWSEQGAQVYLERMIAKAEHNFVVYALKLIAKVEADGQVAATASLSGTDDLWLESTLAVTLADGTVQRWLTKMIWNVSVLGNVFNQYPTRLLK